MNASLPITEITTEWYEYHILRAQRPVLLAVGDHGSRACETLLKLLEAWMKEVGERLDLVLVKAAASPELTRSCGVLLLPGLVLFHQGLVCYQFIGEVSRQELEDILVRVTLFTHTKTTAEPPDVFQPLSATEALP